MLNIIFICGTNEVFTYDYTKWKLIQSDWKFSKYDVELKEAANKYSLLCHYYCNETRVVSPMN